MRKNISVLIILLVIAAAAAIAVIGLTRQLKNDQAESDGLKNGEEMLKALETTVSDWQVYRDDKYGFEFKYPNNFFARTGQTNGDILEISNDKNFRDGEQGLLITVNIGNLKTEENARDILIFQKAGINIEQLEKDLGRGADIMFLGDPPWGYYYISIPLAERSNKYVNFRARTHNKNDPAYGGGYADQKMFYKILSTFKFI